MRGARTGIIVGCTTSVWLWHSFLQVIVSLHEIPSAQVIQALSHKGDVVAEAVALAETVAEVVLEPVSTPMPRP